MPEVASGVAGADVFGVTPSLIILIPYFGRWPPWIDFFIETCKGNPDIEWLLFTDCGEPQNRADNVRIRHLSFADYRALAGERLGVPIDWPEPYKLCDLRPALGHVHADEIAGFDFFGYGDLDVFYGRIREFYTEEALAGHDTLSTHPNILSGHFAVLRNTPEIRGAFELIRNYRELIQLPQYVMLDEGAFSQLFRPPGPLSHLRSLFVERHSTVLSQRGWRDGTMNYPLRWFWKDGRLINERDGDHGFLYLHVMRWQSLRYAPKRPAPSEGAWMRLGQIVNLDWRRAAEEGFCISPAGITPFDTPPPSPRRRWLPSPGWLHRIGARA